MHLHIQYLLGMERGFEVKTDKILHHEVGANVGELLDCNKEERINALVRGINKIILLNLATMNTGNCAFPNICKISYFKTQIGNEY